MPEKDGDPAQTMLSQLAARGGRRTASREAIIQTIARGGHITAEEIVTRVQARFPSVNKSTVYRTLDALADAGVVEHVHFAHGPAVYHVKTDGHRHLYCEKCGSVDEIPSAKTKRFFAMLDREYGFQVDQGHFAIVGTCRACREG
jgi:Fur family transcriptional regulator, ferric uptake regulator